MSCRFRSCSFWTTSIWASWLPAVQAGTRFAVGYGLLARSWAGSASSEKEKHEVRYENGRVQNSLTSYLDPSGPNRFQPYTFKILSLGSEGETIRVKVKIANWLLSLFVPHLQVVYDKEKRIDEYHGVSNILDAGGELHKVHIAYQY